MATAAGMCIADAKNSIIDRNQSIQNAQAINPKNTMLKLPQGDAASLVMYTDKFWPTGSTLKIKFLPSTDWQRAKVKQYIPIWSRYANINFEFVDSGSCNILVSFDSTGGNWSTVGTDSQIRASSEQASMNLGRVYQGQDEDVVSRVILHEFGHALGAVHEHLSPVANIKWNLPAVTSYFGGPPNNWTPEQIETNVLHVYATNEVQNTRFDIDSIMLYSYPASLTLDGSSTPYNTELSLLDKKYIQSCYPGKGFTLNMKPSMMTAVIGRGRVPQYDMFALAPGGSAWHKGRMDNGISNFDTEWENLGGYFASPLRVVSWADERLDLFGRGTDNQCWHKWWDGQQWGPSKQDWQQIGGSLNSSVTAVSWGRDRLDLFALGTDGQMYHKYWDGSQWGPSYDGWEVLGGVFNSDPVAVSWGPNRLDIFAVGLDYQMLHKSWDGSSWGPSQTRWNDLGGSFTSPPAVASWGPNRLDIFGIGLNNQMLHKYWDGSHWGPRQSDWEDLGGAFNSPPAVASWGPNRLDIFGLGVDNQMYHKYWDGRIWGPSQTTWTPIGGTFNNGPSVTTVAPNSFTLVGLGADNQMIYKGWNGRSWVPSQTGWEALSGNFIPKI